MAISGSRSRSAPPMARSGWGTPSPGIGGRCSAGRERLAAEAEAPVVDVDVRRRSRRSARRGPRPTRRARAASSAASRAGSCWRSLSSSATDRNGRRSGAKWGGPTATLARQRRRAGAEAQLGVDAGVAGVVDHARATRPAADALVERVGRDDPTGSRAASNHPASASRNARSRGHRGRAALADDRAPRAGRRSGRVPGVKRTRTASTRTRSGPGLAGGLGDRAQHLERAERDGPSARDHRHGRRRAGSRPAARRRACWLPRTAHGRERAEAQRRASAVRRAALRFMASTENVQARRCRRRWPPAGRWSPPWPRSPVAGTVADQRPQLEERRDRSQQRTVADDQPAGACGVATLPSAQHVERPRRPDAGLGDRVGVARRPSRTRRSAWRCRRGGRRRSAG